MRCAGFQVLYGSGKTLVQVAKPNRALYGLIKNLNNGALRYSSMEAIGLCKLACNIVNEVMKSQEVRRSDRLCQLLLSALLPQFTRCPELISKKR